MNARTLAIPIMIVGLVLIARPVSAEPGQPRSLDDQLLEELGADPLDEFDRELFAPKDSRPVPEARDEKQAEPAGPGDELKRRLLRELGEAANPEDEHPLLAIARKMQDVERQIKQTDSGATTQQQQRKIIAELEELIERAKRCCKQCKPSAASCQGGKRSRRPVNQPKSKPGQCQGKPGSKPAQQSNAKAGTAEPRRADMKEMKALMRELWGELPGRDPEQMLQFPVEEFLPQYELMIEQYYKRLAEEKGIGD